MTRASKVTKMCWDNRRRGKRGKRTLMRTVSIAVQSRESHVHQGIGDGLVFSDKVDVLIDF